MLKLNMFNLRNFESRLILIFLLLVLSLNIQALLAKELEERSYPPELKHEFVFSNWKGPALKVWAYIPSGYNANSQVLFVMHGTNRDADRYRDEWAEIAQANNILLIVPQFNSEDFPGALSYNLGNVFKSNKYDAMNPEEIWAYSAIEPLFDHVKQKYSNNASHYRLYGHSAGSQFVHRFIFFTPEARVAKIVTANAGWYTLPNFNIGFPYGLKNTPVSEADIRISLKQPVVVLLGEADNDPNHRSLRRAAPAMLQGKHRFERGHYFFDQAKQAAHTYDVVFNWKLETVPNVGHKNGLMAKAAIKHLID